MSYVIDGHNLIGVLPGIELGDPDDEQQLVARLRGLSVGGRQGSGSLEVFFDSGSHSGRLTDLSARGINVHFAGPNQSADDAILGFLRQCRQPGQYAVVTNDRELAGRARAAGASTLSATAFAHRLAPHGSAGPSEPQPQRGPDPHDPAYADIYQDFLRQGQGERSAATPAEAAGWSERLYAEDRVDVQRAARWLGVHGDGSALPALRDALTHEDVRVRAEVLLALAALGERSALADLTEHLTKDAGALAREAAAEGLGRLGNRSVVDALAAAAASDPKSRVRKAANLALVQIRARGNAGSATVQVSPSTGMRAGAAGPRGSAGGPQRAVPSDHLPQRPRRRRR